MKKSEEFLKVLEELIESVPVADEVSVKEADPIRGTVARLTRPSDPMSPNYWRTYVRGWGKSVVESVTRRNPNA